MKKTVAKALARRGPLREYSNAFRAIHGENDNLPGIVVDGEPVHGSRAIFARLDEIVDSVFAAGERVVVFTQYAEWGQRLAAHLTRTTRTPVECYHGGLARGARDRMIQEFQDRPGAGALARFPASACQAGVRRPVRWRRLRVAARDRAAGRLLDRAPGKRLQSARDFEREGARAGRAISTLW